MDKLKARINAELEMLRGQASGPATSARVGALLQVLEWIDESRSFGLVIRQNGHGCDYTIGCGMAFHRLVATTRKEAIAQARDMYVKEGNPGSEREFASMTLVVDPDVLPLSQWAEQYRLDASTAKRQREEEAERTELARLRRKYGSHS